MTHALSVYFMVIRQLIYIHMFTRQYNDCQDTVSINRNVSDQTEYFYVLLSEEPTVFSAPPKVNTFFRQIPFINLFPGLSPEWLPGWRDMDLCDRALCQISASSGHLAAECPREAQY